MISAFYPARARSAGQTVLREQAMAYYTKGFQPHGESASVEANIG